MNKCFVLFPSKIVDIRAFLFIYLPCLSLFFNPLLYSIAELTSLFFFFTLSQTDTCRESGGYLGTSFFFFVFTS